MHNLTEHMFDTVADAAASAEIANEVLGRAVADTLAVSAAGFCVGEVRSVATSRPAAATSRHMAWDGSPQISDEEAALVNGMACHALDFDDLHSGSSAHLNAVLLPAVLSGYEWPSEAALFGAMRAGMAAARFLAIELGPGHYESGWHSTSTIGTLATTTALCHLAGLSRETSRHALAIGASQAGGLQANFGSTAKPLHAGFAAAAAIQSVRLASLGIAGAADILSSASFRNAFASPGEGPAPPTKEAPGGATLPKLFPCCFASHRAILAAIKAHEALGRVILERGTRFELTLPRGQLELVSIKVPRSPSEAAFSVTYAVAAAMLDGQVALSHFYEDFGRPDIVALAAKIEVHAEGGQAADLVAGQATLRVSMSSEREYRFVQTGLPGDGPDHSLQAPLRAKIASCLKRFETSYKSTFPMLSRMRAFPHVAVWIPASD